MSNIVINQVLASGPSGVLLAGEPAHLSAECVNPGAEAATGVTVTLALSDGQQGGETFDLAPAESRWVSFDTEALAPGSYELTVTASDASGQLADNGLSIRVSDVQPGVPTPTPSGGGDAPATTDEQRQEGPKLTMNWGDSQLETVDVPEIGSDGEGVA